MWLHMKADRIFFASFLDFETWHFSISVKPRCAFRYFAGDAESIHPDTLEARHQPKGFTIFPEILQHVQINISTSAAAVNRLICDHFAWTATSTTLLSWLSHVLPLVANFVTKCLSLPSYHPGSLHAATLNSRLPSARSPQSVSRTMRSRCHLQLSTAKMNINMGERVTFMSIHSCFRLVYHLGNSLKHPQSNQQLGLTDDMSWQKYSGMINHGK